MFSFLGGVPLQNQPKQSPKGSWIHGNHARKFLWIQSLVAGSLDVLETLSVTVKLPSHRHGSLASTKQGYALGQKHVMGPKLRIAPPSAQLGRRIPGKGSSFAGPPGFRGDLVAWIGQKVPEFLVTKMVQIQKVTKVQRLGK